MTTATLTISDRSNMLGAIATMPEQLRDGFARASELRDAIARSWQGESSPRTLVICGMGGSGVGADLLPAAFATTAPVVAVKGYDLPDWVTDEDRVVCVSYSGNTAETLSCFDQAVKRSVVAVVVTSGGRLNELATAQGIAVVNVPAGYQPRAAVGVLFGALAAIAEALNLVVDAKDTIDQAAAGAQSVIDMHLDATDANGTSPGREDDPPALGMARELGNASVIIYGSGYTVPVAQRWKAQINENSKRPAFANAYPELDHNEIVGWELAGETGGRWALIELAAANVSPAIRRRMDVTRELVSDSLEAALRLDALAISRAGAVFELLVWGDYVSVYLALIRGIDPSPVDRIATLKDRLAGE